MKSAPIVVSVQRFWLSSSARMQNRFQIVAKPQAQTSPTHSNGSSARIVLASRMSDRCACSETRRRSSLTEGRPSQTLTVVATRPWSAAVVWVEVAEGGLARHPWHLGGDRSARDVFRGEELVTGPTACEEQHVEVVAVTGPGVEQVEAGTSRATERSECAFTFGVSVFERP